jgi:mannose-6-phosphate isomerase-like protein (cupin superfamily)
LLLPAGASEGRHRHARLEEIYYVLNGDGEVQVDNETAPIHKGHAVPVLLNQVHSFRNHAAQDLELMIVDIASQKGILDTVEVK